VDLSDKELRIATASARRACRVTKGYLDIDDVIGEVYLWLAENETRIHEWRDHEHGAAILGTACYRAGLRAVDRARRSGGGLEAGDLYYYTTAVVHELLPDVWEHDDWVLSGRSDRSGVRSKSPASEGNNRLAMTVDVRGAVFSLTTDEVEILRDVYADGGTHIGLVGIAHGVTESAMRKRVDRILIKLVEKLGGPPPWSGGRTARSNAAAQAVTE